jgi:hypothetical protein
MSEEWSEVVAKRDGYRVVLHLDDGLGNPREEFDGHICSVVQIDPRSSYIPPDKDGGPLAHIWHHLTAGGELYPLRDAVEPFQRTVAILGGRSLYDTPHEGASCVWYIVPTLAHHTDGTPVQWSDGFPATPENLDRILAGERDEYRSWASGDVYRWTVEKSVGWHRKDGVPGERSTWEHVESCGGYYGYNDAESEARRALDEYWGAPTS